MLPPPVMAELARVQDQISTFSTEEARRVVEKVRVWGDMGGRDGGQPRGESAAEAC